MSAAINRRSKYLNCCLRCWLDGDGACDSSGSEAECGEIAKHHEGVAILGLSNIGLLAA